MAGDIRAQLASIGLDIEQIHTEANPNNAAGVWRVPTDSDKGAKKSGWYVLRKYTAENGDVLIYGRGGNWKTGAEVEIKPDGKGLSAADKKAFAEQQQAAREQAKAEQQARADEARSRAERLWPRLPEQGHSPYLERKGVGAFGVRYARGGAVVVPVRRDKALVGLQFIPADGNNKRFLTGTPKRGACHRIGKLGQNGPILIVEGYATGASLHQATGLPVIVVFDAGNIEPVVAALRKHVRMRTLVICADDDHENEPGPNQAPEQANAGQYKAHAAAAAHAAFVVSPQFNDPSGRTDFNDMHAEQGLQALREYVLGEIKRLVDADEWRLTLVRNKDGKPIATLHNVATIMEHDDRLAGLLQMDEFANKVVFSREPPFGGGMREISDAEVAELAAWFGHPDTYGLNVATGLMHEVVGMVAARNTFHPVRDYLNALQWDGEARIPTMLRDYFGVTLDDYSRQVALNFMISAAARVMHPGCKCDLMLILEGAQGAGKSTAIEVLCGRDWFAEATEPPESKDFYQILQGRWILEIAEMQSFSKAQVSRVKAAVSTPVDVYRPSYGRMARAFPRQSIFVGSTNEDEYLRDPTGARRFMPVRVGGVDLDLLRDDRDQLWAEAVTRLHRGECYWDLPAQAEDEREQRYMQDSWTDPVLDWLDGRGEDYPAGMVMIQGRYPATVNIDQVLTYALRLDKSRQTRQEQMRLGAIIKRLGWTKVRKRVDGRQRWFYERPNGDQPRNDVAGEESIDGF